MQFPDDSVPFYLTNVGRRVIRVYHPYGPSVELRVW